MGVKAVLAKVGNKAADLITKSAVLSQLQLQDIEDKRKKYLEEKPDPNDYQSIKLTEKLLAACGVEIYNTYLKQIHEIYRPIDSNIELENEFNAKRNIRYFNITKWVVDKDEQSLDKLINVYETLSNEECNIALVFNRTKNETKVYLAVVNLKNESIDKTVDEYNERLKSAIKGNFPGTICEKSESGSIPCLNGFEYSVASVSNIPTEKSEKFLSQTIEKLLDGIVPQNKEEEYTLVLLATPAKDIDVRKLRLGEFYSALNPFAKWETSFQVQESNANSSTGTFGVNIGAGAGIQCGTNHSNTISKGQSDSESITESRNEGESIAKAASFGTNTSKGSNIGSSDSLSGGGSVGIKPFGIGADVDAHYGHGWSRGTSEGHGTFSSIGETVSKVTSSTIGKTLGKAITNTIADTNGTNQGKSFGINFGANFARSSTITANIGKNEGINQSFINYNIKHTLELLEEQMKRLEVSSALGMWDFAAYILSENPTVVKNVAHSYLALTQGEKSFLSSDSINVWIGNKGEESEDAKEISKYISELRHPVFALNPDITNKDDSLYVYPTTIDATTNLSGKELAYSLNFPKKSITGLPVIECARFGRNISTFDEISTNEDKLSIGKIFHMHHMENESVDISKKSLASHMFITGSTGSGKSNTVYQILSEAIKNDVKFMVVEPTKGEYKDIFCVGDKSIAKVYGTNAEKTPLLRINPFSFPKDIHIYEHMDRLVEIFNVCWPMYAAMPAVLKNAIEKAYEDCGWNLIDSKNPYGDNLYPNFNDVARNVKQIIESSEYDAENKGAYKGSLLTRLQSLTNGINGLIFTNNEISLEELFDENVIIDISRVGSNETKSLIMGMMVLKLQEYRIANRDTLNADLKHLTVLEEAHNLLKRTSTEVSQDSGNLLGKSVEMVSNAIAEMRTYGEGFIIVDQAPGLLDMAAIRNTNTKIIMRLPDEMDRKLVGKAANLNDDQIIELAKLPCGVGAMYQNEWIEPVLCKVNKYESKGSKYNFTNSSTFSIINDSKDCIRIANILIKNLKVEKNIINDINERVNKMDLSSYCKVLIKKTLLNMPVKPLATKLAPIMSELFRKTYETMKEVYKNGNEIEWTRITNETLNQEIQNETIDIHTRRKIIQSIMTQYLYNDLNQVTKLEKWSKEGGLFDEVR